MKAGELQRIAAEAFATVVARAHGFRERPGQARMAHAVAEAFAAALSDENHGIKPKLVVAGGTGTGKTAAYLAPALALAVKTGTRLVVSTATVALQEQIFSKDLPAVIAALGVEARAVIVKGRGRYLCAAKLTRLERAGTLTEAAGDGERVTIQLPARLRRALDMGWRGDYDSLQSPPDPGEWAKVSADRHTCTGRGCPQLRSCAFYAARREVQEAKVLVVNHDLLMASLGTGLLPEFENSMLVIDEAHELAEVAQQQCAAAIDLTRLGWLDKLAPALKAAAKRLELAGSGDVRRMAREMKSALNDCGTLVLDLMGSHLRERDGVCRFSHGIVPEFLYEPLALVESHCRAVSAEMAMCATALRERMAAEPGSKEWQDTYATLGGFSPRLGEVAETIDLLLHGEDRGATAKWVSATHTAAGVSVMLQASPVTPSAQLENMLWSRARCAVLTSATLTACGSFDFFLEATGLLGRSDVKTLKVSSPFDFGRQAKLIVVDTNAEPSSTRAFNAEVAARLAEDLARVQAGALVLCTSRAQLAAVVDSLPAQLRPLLLVQGTARRSALLAEHRQRVRDGAVSILVGMASFGQGLDLPGAECADLFILKVPFAPVDDPVGEARAEQIRKCGGDPFDEQVLPEASIRLQQWTGRAIRTEQDSAVIRCYDRRLLRKEYGRRMLLGLPPYALFQESGSGLAPVHLHGRS